MLQEYMANCTVYQGSEPEVVSRYVKEHIGMHSIKNQGRGAGDALLRLASFEALNLGVISYGRHTIVDNEVGLDDYHLHFVIRGACRLRVKDELVRLGPGAGIVVNPMTPTAVEYSPQCIKLMVNLPRSVIRHYLGARMGVFAADDLSFINGPAHVSSNASMLNAIAQLCCEAEEERAGARRFPVADFQPFFVSKVLESFPTNLDCLPSADRRQEFFEKLDAFIERNINTDISSDDMAKHCNVSLRALYDKFAKHKGVSPNVYLKNKKLLRVYECLSGKRGAPRSVSEVAIEHGFYHLGRFASDYKALFNELPSATLKRVLERDVP